MNAKLLNPSNYFGAGDLLALGTTFEIASVRLEDVEEEGKKGEPAKTKKKGSILLKGADKWWLCNVTNTKCLVAMFGDETDQWIGKRVTLHEERVLSFGEWVPGVRVTGSPDITAPVSVRMKLRKKKEQVLTMQPTGAKSPKPTPPKPDDHYGAMWRDYKAAGQSDQHAFKALVKSATGKMTGFAPDDVFKFSEALKALLSPPASPDDPPPPSDADAPLN